MIGTLLNTAAVIVGGILGTLLGGRLPERLRQTVILGIGLFTIAYGLQMFLTTKNPLIVLGSLLIGGIVGELLKIEDGLEALGSWLEKRFSSQPAAHPQSSFLRGFLTATLVFCVGPMAILGAVKDGLTGDYSILAVKAVLDGFTALAFSSSLGVGVLFSVVILFAYQGGLSLLASQVQALVTPAMMGELNATGGVILIGIAISSVLAIKKIRVGSLLPALIMAPLITALAALLGLSI